LQKLRTAFAEIDRDNSGQVTYAEMASAMKNQGLDAAQVETLMRNMVCLDVTIWPSSSPQ
jgi:Ca2+-binding EF-hand superfamily protein